MTIIVNGQSETLPEAMTIAELIARHKLTPDKVAVEVNRRLVRARDYERKLQEGDQVELVTFVGGG